MESEIDSAYKFAQAQQPNTNQSTTIKQIVLSKLLDSVRQCQTEFGAKNELATTESSKVSFLLLQLESVLTHGLKRKAGLFSDVSALVNKVLQVENFATVIWLMIKRLVLSNQEIEVYGKFNHLTNDSARVRSWLRMILNEKSLRRNFDSLISSLDISEYYDECAFLRDAEMTSAFCQMATGLQTILFALKTNDPVLNMPAGLNCEDISIDIVSAASNQSHRVPQPILNVSNRSSTPNAEASCETSPKKNADPEKTKARRFKKPLVNFVSFDENKSITENDCQMRVVFPTNRSTSLSTYPSSQKGGNARNLSIGKPDRLASLLSEQNRNDQDDSCDQILFLEKADSINGGGDTSSIAATSDTSGTNVFGTADSNSLSDEEHEDSSSFHSEESSLARSKCTSVDKPASSLQFKDELLKRLNIDLADLRQTLQSVQTEHEHFVRMHEIKLVNLKIQCENAIRAVENKKIVKTSANLSCANCSTSLKSTDQDEPDIEEVLDTYQKRLTQLSNMHSELLELNDYLLKENRLKTKVNERLKLELISLRGPLPDDLLIECPALQSSSSHNVEHRTLVNIWIPTAFLTGKGTDVHYVYQVYLRLGDSEWNVYRRYKEFLALHEKLCKRDSFLRANFKFPPKKKFGSKKKAFVDARRRELEQYLRLVVNYVAQNFPEFRSLPVSKETLSHLMPFFRT